MPMEKQGTVENQLAHTIDQTEYDSRYDRTAKKLLANKQILAQIMKGCVNEYSDCTVDDIVEKYIEGTPEVGSVGVHVDDTNRPKKSIDVIKGSNNEDSTLFNKYDTLNKISFDYAVVEHEPEIEVMRFAGTWKDLGTWNTLTEAMDSHAVGEALFNEKCENVHVVNELDVPILCMGLKDVVVSASPEGILVSDKEQSSYIKPFVNTLDHRVMFAEKSWGSFKVIDIDKASMTIKVTLNAGHRMNYHSHQHRDEVWTVIAGEGKTVVDGMEQNVKAGDVITMSAAV